MNSKIDPDFKEIKRIVKRHNRKANIREKNNIISIQLNGNNGLNDIVLKLTTKEYTFEVIQDFELPCIIKVHSKVNPEI